MLNKQLKLSKSVGAKGKRVKVIKVQEIAKKTIFVKLWKIRFVDISRILDMPKYDYTIYTWSYVCKDHFATLQVILSTRVAH